jgi:hypothetical protein
MTVEAQILTKSPTDYQQFITLPPDCLVNKTTKCILVLLLNNFTSNEEKLVQRCHYKPLLIT